MTSRTRVVVAIVLAGVTACSNWDSGLSPAEVQLGNGKPTPEYPAPPFAALTKPGTIYVERNPAPSVNPVQTATRYVLYDDGTFGLQMSSIAAQSEFGGHYTRADSLISFDWDGWSSAGAWTSSAILHGEELVVTYGDVMVMTDFVDETYVRAR